MKISPSEEAEAFRRATDLFTRAKFAPGNYCNRCIDCQWLFVGDKLAQRCFSCAAELITKAEQLDVLGEKAG
jgi:hypothetical protein